MLARLAPYRLAFMLAIRDLRGGVSGFRLYIAALALGVAAIFTVGTMRLSLEAAIERDATLMLGGDARLSRVQRAPTTDEWAFLQNEAGGLSLVTSMRAMIYAANGQNHIVELDGVDKAYPLYGQVEMQAGSMEFHRLHDEAMIKNGRHPLISDARILTLLGVKIGDDLTLGEGKFYLAGIAKTIPDESGSIIRLGPKIRLSNQGLAATKLVQPGSIVRYHTRLILKPPKDYANFKNRFDGRFDDHGYRMRGLDKAAPAIQRFNDRVGSFLNLVSLAILIIGGAGAANAVRSFLIKKSMNIAAMKAVGAPQHLIFMIYLMESLMMAGLGIMIGLALGIGFLLVLQPILAGYLSFNFVIEVHAIPILSAAGLGLCVTFIFILWQLGQAAKLPVASLFRAAGNAVFADRFSFPSLPIIASIMLLAGLFFALAWLITPDKQFLIWFIIAVLALVMIFAALGHFATYLVKRFLTHPANIALRLAKAGLLRPHNPNLWIAISLGLCLSLLAGIGDLQQNLQRQFDNVDDPDRPSFFVMDVKPSQLPDIQTKIKDYEALHKVTVDIDHTPILRGAITKMAGRPTSQMTPPDEFEWVLHADRSLTWSPTPLLGGESKIAQGQWWPEHHQGEQLVSFDEEAANAFNLKLGDEIEINLLGRPIRATISNLRSIDWSSMQMNFLMVFSPGLISTAPHNLLVSLQMPTAHEDGIEKLLTDHYKNISVIRVREAMEMVLDMMAQLSFAVQAISALALIAGLFVLLGALSAEQSLRLNDATIYKVLGVTKWQQLAAWGMEYGFIALMAAFFSVSAGAGFGYYIVEFIMNFDYQPNIVNIFVLLLLALMLVMPISMMAGFRTLTKAPLNQLRNL